MGTVASAIRTPAIPAASGMFRKSQVFLPRYQKFESISLQRGVTNELSGCQARLCRRRGPLSGFGRIPLGNRQRRHGRWRLSRYTRGSSAASAKEEKQSRTGNKDCEPSPRGQNRRNGEGYRAEDAGDYRHDGEHAKIRADQQKGSEHSQPPPERESGDDCGDNYYPGQGAHAGPCLRCFDREVTT
jgi:hypothetical protein